MPQSCCTWHAGAQSPTFQPASHLFRAEASQLSQQQPAASQALPQGLCSCGLHFGGRFAERCCTKKGCVRPIFAPHMTISSPKLQPRKRFSQCTCAAPSPPPPPSLGKQVASTAGPTCFQAPCKHKAACQAKQLTKCFLPHQGDVPTSLDRRASAAVVGCRHAEQPQVFAAAAP